MTTRRLIHPGLLVGIVVLFLSFAGVQLNDPDSWRWVLAYVWVALMWLWAAFKPLSHRFVRGVGILYGIAAVWFWPGRIDGISGEMMSARPHIEQARESGGLLVGALFLLGLAYLLQVRMNRESSQQVDSD